MCKAWTLNCIGNQPCHLMCDRTSACQGYKYICPDEHECIAHCTETSTCQGATFKGSWQAICSGTSSCQGSSGFKRTTKSALRLKELRAQTSIKGIDL